jgi:hypothetical protein
MDIPDVVRSLERDLRSIFGSRLKSVVAYGNGAAGREPDQTLAVVDHPTIDDLRAVADRIAAWHDLGLATPLLLGAHEFARSLDAFPYEFGAILSNHAVVSGANPFEGLRVDPSDLRRACEVQARSHLLHLREGYLETRGRSDALADLIARSAPAFTGLVENVKRLSPGWSAPDIVQELQTIAGGKLLTSERARKLFPDYLAAVDGLVHYIDELKTDGR